jgi:hypothetical protein
VELGTKAYIIMDWMRSNLRKPYAMRLNTLIILDDIKANASVPADVPSCCASNSCLWDLGSNINGGIP